MRKQRFVFLALFLAVMAVPVARAESDLPAIVKRISPSVVGVICYDKDGEVISQGSGFFINKQGHIATNRHVLRSASRAEVKTAEGEVYPVTKTLAEDVDGDLMLVSVEILPEKVQPLTLSSSLPDVGENVVVIGSPFGLEQTVTDGIVSAVRDIQGFGHIIQITAPASPGSSGSPVVNMKGKVIGVASFQIVEGQNLNFAIPSERVTGLTRGRTSDVSSIDEPPSAALDGLPSRRAEGPYFTGLSFIWIEDYENALSYFEKAVKKNPRDADAHFYVGCCRAKLGRFREAIEAYKQAIRIKPDFAEAHCCLGLDYGSLGRFREAIEAFKQAIRINPNFAEAHGGLGMAYFSLGRFREAIEAYKQAIRIKPDYAGAHFELGGAYIGLRRWGEATEAYKQAIRIKPDYAGAHCNLGVAYGSLGRWSEAIEACKQAIRINPDLTKAHYGLGVAYLFLGDKGSALEEYKILKDLDKNLANKLFNLIYK